MSEQDKDKTQDNVKAEPPENITIAPGASEITSPQEDALETSSSEPPISGSDAMQESNAMVTKALLASVTTIKQAAEQNAKGFKTQRYMVGFIISLGFVGLLSGVVMLYVLQSAIKQASAISIAMGSRLMQFEVQMNRVDQLKGPLDDLLIVSQQQAQGTDMLMHYLKQVGTDALQAASQQGIENKLMLGSVNDKILTSFDALKITTKAQQGVLTQLKKRIDGVQLQMNKVENQDLVGKMKALIALEQERYFELEKAKLDLETAQFEAKKKSEASPVEGNYITFGAEPK
ncbi:hypothetical protein ABXT60_03890 [Candidatus Njordibacter sp. Uisw_056]|uniref:hypothetical protein n=1 Tax=Candidatus Njordibacter sp. Uisw_056 TaxID=3230973 RepID=UPI003D3DDCDE